jgi:MFS transporter, PPP family, 3-phenylpropionic acid transporter
MALRMGLTAGLPLVWPLLLLAQALHAITFAAHHTVCIALMSHHFPGRLRGRGQALYTVVGYGLPGRAGRLVGGCSQSALGAGDAVFWRSGLKPVTSAVASSTSAPPAKMPATALRPEKCGPR